MWDAVVSALGPDVRAIRYDTRGHGRSDAPSGPYTVADLGGDAIAVLTALGIERAVVCGLSLGGVTAMWMGVHAPKRVKGLVLANTAALLPPAAMWRDRAATVRAGGLQTLVQPSMERWFTPGFRERDPTTVQRGAAMIVGTSAEGYAGCCEALATADLRGEIGRIGAPTLVIVGDSDPSTTPAMGEEIRAAVPGAELAVLRAAHLSALEQPDAFADAIRGRVAA
jgi:3-oxoadipate enol-lactonase